MAVVRRFVASNGARVTIYDDDYADASPEELERRRQEQERRTAKAIEEAKTDYKTDIARLKTTNPPEALKMIKAYMASFPAEGAEYKDEIADLTVKAKEFAAEQKAKGAKK